MARGGFGDLRVTFRCLLGLQSKEQFAGRRGKIQIVRPVGGGSAIILRPA